jgi:hypothetical protein
MRVQALDLGEKLPTIHAGYAHVAYDYIGGSLSEDLMGRRAA